MLTHFTPKIQGKRSNVESWRQRTTHINSASSASSDAGHWPAAAAAVVMMEAQQQTRVNTSYQSPDAWSTSQHTTWPHLLLYTKSNCSSRQCISLYHVLCVTIETECHDFCSFITYDNLNDQCWLGQSQVTETQVDLLNWECPLLLLQLVLYIFSIFIT